MKSEDSHEYDIEEETATNREMLENRIPSRLNTIKLALIEIDKLHTYEPWRLALAVDFLQSIECYCEQLLETMNKDRLAASTWIARNLLELQVWVKYCGVSRENAWRFHEDALRDLSGLMDSHKQCCDAMDIEDEASAIAAQHIQNMASEELGLENIDSKFLRVANAAKAPGVDLGGRFGPFHRALSKFVHPTAGLVHGISHQAEGCRQLQASFTTEGVYFAVQSILEFEEQLGIPSSLM